MTRNILVLKPSSLGDVVHTLPAVARLKQRFPGAVLRWLVNPEWAPLLNENPDVDEVIIFPRKDLGGLSRVLKQMRWIQQTGAAYQSELVVDFQGLLRSALIGRACRAPGSDGRFFGLSDAREGARFFYDEAVQLGSRGTEHAVERYLRLADLVTGETDAQTSPNHPGFRTPLSWPLPGGAPPAGFDVAEPFIVLHPFSRGKGKSLTLEQVQSFCRAYGGKIVLLGRADVADVVWPENVANWLNRTSLEELIWVIRRASYTVSVDSGPMHIAAALTARLVSIHFWSEPRLVGPYNPEAWVWRAGALQQMRQIKNPTQQPEECAIPDMKALGEWVRQNALV
jgi:heptosyltransferase-1